MNIKIILQPCIVPLQTYIEVYYLSILFIGFAPIELNQSEYILDVLDATFMTTTLNQMKTFLDILCVSSYTFYSNSAWRFSDLSVGLMWIICLRPILFVGRLKMMEK